MGSASSCKPDMSFESPDLESRVGGVLQIRRSGNIKAAKPCCQEQDVHHCDGFDEVPRSAPTLRQYTLAIAEFQHQAARPQLCSSWSSGIAARSWFHGVTPFSSQEPVPSNKGQQLPTLPATCSCAFLLVACRNAACISRAASGSSKQPSTRRPNHESASPGGKSQQHGACEPSLHLNNGPWLGQNLNLAERLGFRLLTEGQTGEKRGSSRSLSQLCFKKKTRRSCQTSALHSLCGKFGPETKGFGPSTWGHGARCRTISCLPRPPLHFPSERSTRIL